VSSSPAALGVAVAVIALARVAAAQEGPEAMPAPAQVSRVELKGDLDLVLPGAGDEVVVVIRRLDLRLPDQGLELRADHAVLWGDRDLLQLIALQPAPRADGDPLHFGPEIPGAPDRPALRRPSRADPVATATQGLREIYAEGHVFFRQGEERVLLAERLYQHLLERRGVVVAADAYGRSAYSGHPVEVHVRARALRALGPGELAAEEAQFSTCAYGHPHWHVQSDFLRARLEARAGGGAGARVDLSGNRLEVGDLALLPMPDFTADVAEGDAMPLRKVQLGHSSKFGAYAQTLWSAELPAEARAIEESLALGTPLDLRWEGALDFYSRRGAGIGPALQWSAPGLLEGEIGGYWIHDRADEDYSRPFDIEHPDRARGYLRDRFTPVEHWRLDTEVGWFSDAGFQPEYFEREFKEEKEPESYAHLVRQEETARFRVLYRNRLNDFQTQVDELPQATFEQVGEPLWELSLPGFLERDGEESRLVLSHYEDVGNRRFHPEEGSGLSSERVARADSRIELSTTIPVGPASLRPFAAGQFTAWDRSAVNDNNLGRAAGIAGARSELLLHRNYDAWSPALGIDGMRHVVLLDADYQNVYDVSRDPDRLIPIDEVDRLDEREVYVLGVRQRLQTHRRVEPGVDSIVNVFELDLELPLYPHAERDNVGTAAGRSPGETAGPLRYDFVHRPGFTGDLLRNCALFADGEWNLHEATMDVVNLGAQLQPTLDWTTLASWRVTRGVSRVLTGEIDWRLAEKWSVAVLEQYDFAASDGLEHRFELRRHGHDFTFSMGFEHDSGDGDTAFRFTIYPSFLRKGRAERSLAAGRGSTPGLDQVQN